jgi:peroxiredoxin
MRKLLFFVALVISFHLQAQHVIKGTIQPNHDYSWILLYKMQNGDQTYVANADVEDGKFQFDINEDEPSGIYRAYYQIESNLYVEFIYNKEPVEFTFDPEHPDRSIFFTSSKENTVYRYYYDDIKARQKKIDSIQVLYFKIEDQQKSDALTNQYTNYLKELSTSQTKYEKQSEGLLANHFIRASKQYNAPEPQKNADDYLNGIKSHFFDYMDLSDEVLRHSSFINDRLSDYVLYLHQNEDPQEEMALQKKAIENAIGIIGDDNALLSSFQEDLLETYMIRENAEMMHFIMDNYFSELPVEYQSITLKKKVEAALKTGIGMQAPNFFWEKEGKEHSLYGLTGTDYYIVLFFSSNCPHCQQEIPEFYSFISGIHNIKVVAVGLEDEEESWRNMIDNYAEFINILDLDKWSSQKVQDYGITEIPTYLVLDSDKKILAKPYNFKQLKSMFETR